MSEKDNQEGQRYQVLARKYRPATFKELIGQDAMVRTLTNSIKADRLPHAFILTGVRGIGKTTTARIIARSLNCIGEDEKRGPTPAPCGVCNHCIAISEDRHVDVIEMDAASRTGVNDIRELIDGVRYRPVEARFKVYIIDEVHMLSVNAFNALLKTLEEPPEHVKFIFATTETRKIPVTVLSRCQRFDLRRVGNETLIKHLTEIMEKESISLSEGALGMIARAADGSVRDGLSLLDQAFAHSGINHTETVSEEVVRNMLGLADSGRLYDLFQVLMEGSISKALDIFRELYDSGADPALVLQDLLGLTHWLTRIKISPTVSEAQGISQLDREHGVTLAKELSISTLGRTWQLLLKGISEVQSSPHIFQAAEMVLIRLAYMSELPTPEELVRSLEKEKTLPSVEKKNLEQKHSQIKKDPKSRGLQTAEENILGEKHLNDSESPNHTSEKEIAIQDESSESNQWESPTDFNELVGLFAEHREATLHAILMNYVRLVRFEKGQIELTVDSEVPSDFANRVSTLLSKWTGEKWSIVLSDEIGKPTLREQSDADKEARDIEAKNHPLVQAALDVFPGAKVKAVMEGEPKGFQGQRKEILLKDDKVVDKDLA